MAKSEWPPPSSRLADRLPDPRDVVFGAILLIGVWVALEAMDRYPWLDENLSILGVGVPITAFVIAFGLLARARRRLMPWGAQAPILMWGGMAGIAAGVAIWAVALLFIANGALDRSASNYVKFVVTKRKRWDTNFVLALRPVDPAVSSPKLRSGIHVTEDDWRSTPKESAVLVDVRPGFLHLRWVAGYRLCDPASDHCR